MAALLVLICWIGLITVHAKMAAPGLGHLSVAIDLCVWLFNYLVLRLLVEKKK